jgi:hypothetical protein
MDKLYVYKITLSDGGVRTCNIVFDVYATTYKKAGELAKESPYYKMGRKIITAKRMEEVID